MQHSQVSTCLTAASLVAVVRAVHHSVAHLAEFDALARTAHVLLRSAGGQLSDAQTVLLVRAVQAVALPIAGAVLGDACAISAGEFGAAAAAVGAAHLVAAVSAVVVMVAAWEVESFINLSSLQMFCFCLFKNHLLTYWYGMRMQRPLEQANSSIWHVRLAQFWSSSAALTQSLSPSHTKFRGTQRG